MNDCSIFGCKLSSSKCVVMAPYGCIIMMLGPVGSTECSCCCIPVSSCVVLSCFSHSCQSSCISMCLQKYLGNQNDQKPDDQKPADQKPDVQKPDDQKPADQKPDDQKPVDTKVHIAAGCSR